MWRKAKNSLSWGLFVFPALAVVAAVIIIPIFGGFYYSVTNWDGLSKNMDFIGFDNYRRLFSDSRFAAIIGHTVLYSVVITVFQNLFGFLLALVMVRQFHGRNFFRAVFYMPAVLSSLTIGYSWSFILNGRIGALNEVLKAVGLGALATDWLGDANFSLLAVAFVVVWQYSGYSMLIYIVGLQAIPEELFEAGNIEGTTGWQRIRHITFPLVAPAFTINIMLTLISTLKAFDHVFVMTRGGPGFSSELIATQLYKEAFTYNNMGYGAAISVVLFVMTAVFSLVILRHLRKREEY